VSPRINRMFPRNTAIADEPGYIDSLKSSSASASAIFPAEPVRNAAVFNDASRKSYASPLV